MRVIATKPDSQIPVVTPTVAELTTLSDAKVWREQNAFISLDELRKQFKQ